MVTTVQFTVVTANISEDSVNVKSVKDSEGWEVSTASASTMRVVDLAKRGAQVVVAAPWPLPGPSTQTRLAAVERELSTVKAAHSSLLHSHTSHEQSHKELQRENTKLQQGLATTTNSLDGIRQEFTELNIRHTALQRTVSLMQAEARDLRSYVQGAQHRQVKIARRVLMDGARTKLNEGRALTPDQKTAWNERVHHLTDQQLEAFGLTRGQVLLTRYGPNTLQQQGGDAAHIVDLKEVAEAVTAANNEDLLRLFEYVYGRSAQELVFQAEPAEDPWADLD